MKTIKGKRADLEKQVASLIAEKLSTLARTKKEIIFGIVGGSSVSGIYKNLLSEKIPWKKVNVFMVDERIVPVANEDSNFKLAEDSFINDLVEKGKLPQENLHPFFEHRGVEVYTEEFKQYGKEFDLVLLSAGEDGHVGALFPNYTIEEDGDYFIELDESPKPPKARVTASRKLLERSGTAIVLFFGDKKKKAYEKFKDSKTSVESCPAKLVEKVKDSYVFIDL